MEALSKSQKEIEQNKAFEALHYVCLQAIEILKPDENTGVCSPENVAMLIKFKFPEMPISVEFKEVNYMAVLKQFGEPIRNEKTGAYILYPDNQLNFVFKSAFFTYNMRADAIAPIYKKLKNALPKYQHTYQLQFFNAADEVGEYVCTITNKKEFKDIATHAADKKETLRPIMQAVYIDPFGVMVASDSHTLKTAKIETNGGLLLPIDCHKYIIDNKEPSIISQSAEQIYIKHGDKIKSFAKLEGKYPAWQAVIPQPSGKVVIFDKAELLEAVKIAGKHCNQASHLIKFNFDKIHCIVSAQDIDFGLSSKTEIPCKSNMRGEIGINLYNLIKAIKGVSGDQIKFELTDATRCVMINDTCLVMPMMIGNGTSKADKFECIADCTVPQLAEIEPKKTQAKKEPKQPKEKRKTWAQLKRDALMQEITEPQQAAPIEPKQDETKYLPVLYIAPAEIVSNLPIIYIAPEAITATEPMRYLPVLYVKPKKIRKPRAKKNKEPKKQTEIKTYSQVNHTPQQSEHQPKRLLARLLKPLQYVAMIAIILILQSASCNKAQIPIKQSTDYQHPKNKNSIKTKINVDSYCINQNSVYICEAITQNTLTSQETANQMRTFKHKNFVTRGKRNYNCTVKSVLNL